MRKGLRAWLLVVGVCVLVAQVPTVGQVPETFESITFADTAVGFTATTIRPAGGFPMTHCWGKLETAQIRVRFDGTDPTAAVGVPIDVGEVFHIYGHARLRSFRGIRTGATSGVIQWSCDREQLA